MKKYISLFSMLCLSILCSQSWADNQIAEPATGTPGLITQSSTVYVRSNSNTLCPNQDIETIQDALNCLGNYKIAANVIVTISVTEQPSNIYQTITVNHSDGDRIHIVGACKNDPNGMCTLQFAAGENGLVVQNGNKLGLFDNFTLLGSQASSTNEIAGVLADKNGTIILGHNITVEEFYNGIWANNHSYIFAQYDRANNNYNGMLAQYNSTINAEHSLVEKNQAGGIKSSQTSGIDAQHAKSDNNATNFQAMYSSNLNLKDATSENSTGNTGIYSGTASSVIANGITASGSQYALSVEFNGVILCNGSDTNHISGSISKAEGGIAYLC